nr:hypothetical protein [Tanacetum cinerariifolium]
MSSVRTPQQNGVLDRRNQTLVEAAKTMLILSRAPLFLWAEAIATACYSQNRYIIHRQFNKTPYELINGRKPDISFLHVFGSIYYPKNDHEDIGFPWTKKIMETMNVTFDELSAMAFEKSSSKPRLQSMTSGQITMYDDYIGGKPSAAPRTAPAAQAPQFLQTLTELETQQQHVQHQPATLADNVPNAMFDENTFVNPFATPSTSGAGSSSSQYVDPSNIHMFYQPHPHEYQWTKDHPLEQVIEEPPRPVLTRNQLRFDGNMCMYALTVSIMETKNVKEAMTDPAWIESVKEELFQFKRLDVWVLVPSLDNINP